MTENDRSPRVNRLGETYGKLTVIAFEGWKQQPTSHHKQLPMWKCRCTCGKTRTVSSMSLTGGCESCVVCARKAQSRRKIFA